MVFLIAILIFNGQSVLAQDHFGVPPMAGLPPGPVLGPTGPDSVAAAQSVRFRLAPSGRIATGRAGPRRRRPARRRRWPRLPSRHCRRRGPRLPTAAIGPAPSLPAAVDHDRIDLVLSSRDFPLERAVGRADFVNEYGPLSTLGYQHRSGIERFRFEILAARRPTTSASPMTERRTHTTNRTARTISASVASTNC